MPPLSVPGSAGKPEASAAASGSGKQLQARLLDSMAHEKKTKKEEEQHMTFVPLDDGDGDGGDKPGVVILDSSDESSSEAADAAPDFTATVFWPLPRPRPLSMSAPPKMAVPVLTTEEEEDLFSMPAMPAGKQPAIVPGSSVVLPNLSDMALYDGTTSALGGNCDVSSRGLVDTGSFEAMPASPESFSALNSAELAIEANCIEVANELQAAFEFSCAGGGWTRIGGCSRSELIAVPAGARDVQVAVKDGVGRTQRLELSFGALQKKLVKVSIAFSMQKNWELKKIEIF